MTLKTLKFSIPVVSAVLALSLGAAGPPIGTITAASIGNAPVNSAGETPMNSIGSTPVSAIGNTPATSIGNTPIYGTGMTPVDGIGSTPINSGARFRFNAHAFNNNIDPQRRPLRFSNGPFFGQ